MRRKIMTKIRGFEAVAKEHITAYNVFTDEKGVKHSFAKEITLPTRADKHSAGYDFYIPKEVVLAPMQKTIIWTDVKAYMQKDEMLNIYIRSSLAIKQGIMLSNNVGIIDSSYYNNEGNDGNIGVSLVNTTGKTVTLAEGSRFAQGIFVKYLVADEDNVLASGRAGGIGSSGK